MSKERQEISQSLQVVFAHFMLGTRGVRPATLPHHAVAATVRHNMSSFYEGRLKHKRWRDRGSKLRANGRLSSEGNKCKQDLDLKSSQTDWRLCLLKINIVMLGGSNNRGKQHDRQLTCMAECTDTPIPVEFPSWPGLFRWLGGRRRVFASPQFRL